MYYAKVKFSFYSVNNEHISSKFQNITPIPYSKREKNPYYATRKIGRSSVQDEFVQIEKEHIHFSSLFSELYGETDLEN